MIESVINALRPVRIRGKGRIFNQLLPRTGLRTVDAAKGVRMALELSDGQQRQMFIGCFNLPVRKILRRLLSPGDTFLDVGANVGFFSLEAAMLVGPAGRVISFEPYPPNLEKFRNNLQLNPHANVDLREIALSHQPGHLQLYAPPPDSHRDFNVSVVPQPGTRFTVPCQTLDQCLAAPAPQPVKLMKLDVEGAEPQVLKGGRESLRAGRVMHLVCEINAGYLRGLGSSPHDLLDQILDLGFLNAKLAGPRALPTTSNPTIDDHDDPDLLFVHKSAVQRA